jgi:hypothetical protein
MALFQVILLAYYAGRQRHAVAFYCIIAGGPRPAAASLVAVIMR